MYSVLKRILIGRPLSTSEESHERLTKRVALAIFSSDAIASTAFASQEILVVLVPVIGMAALGYLVPISVCVVVLLVIVVASYCQTLYAYPSGGGSYVVSRENLGTGSSLVAGSALMVDYTLTVSVSIAAAVAAITSAIEPLRDHRVALGLVLIGLLTLANLRGVRESGRLFAPPTYTYIIVMGAMVVWGLVRTATGSLEQLPVDRDALESFTGAGALTGGVTLYLLMRAFSSGAIALSGIEAISNGIQVFRKPVSRNAAITLICTGAILGGLFFGIAVLAEQLRPTLSEDQTVLSIMGRAVFGDGPLYWLLQAATAGILILSANTAYAGFPRLTSMIAADGFLPRQLAHRGDRLVYSNGIIVLAVAAGVLFAGFGGETSSLVPLFAVGLFLSFTLSQAGMVVHHWRLREPRWIAGLVINGTGAAATSVVTVVVVVSKFTEGAWVPVIVIPAFVVLFKSIRRHYDRVRREIAVTPGTGFPEIRNTVVVLVGTEMNRGALEAVAYARSLRPEHLFALTVTFDEEDERRVREQWEAFDIDVPLEIIGSPYREITGPVLQFIDDLDARWEYDVLTVVIPEFVVHHWWEQLLHNQSALWLKARLLFRPNTVVTSVPTQVD
jgi:amino acid transporter